MKKQIIVAILSLVPTMGFAKISDFNAMISENVKSQKDLHSMIKHNVHEAQVAAQTQEDKREKIVLIDNNVETYNAPSRKGLTVFEKEKTFHRASENRQLDRIATEVSSLRD